MKAVEPWKSLPLVALMFLFAPAAWSADANQSVAELKSPAQVYVSPPEYKLFAGYKLPEAAGMIKAGEKVRVVDKTTVGYPWYKENWYLVKT
jgi:hypothetical protein